jgi:hypothetical protein
VRLHDWFRFSEKHISSTWADAAGAVVFRKRLLQSSVLQLFACDGGAGSFYWTVRFLSLGHEVRLVPRSYVKPAVKRWENDVADEKATCEALQRPTMRSQVRSLADCGGAHVGRLIAQAADQTHSLPEAVRLVLDVLTRNSDLPLKDHPATVRIPTGEVARSAAASFTRPSAWRGCTVRHEMPASFASPSISLAGRGPS